MQALLVEAFDGEFSDEDWENTLGGWHVVVAEGGVAVAHAAVVPRLLRVGDRPFRSGYLEGVATLTGRQREGLGSRAVAEATGLLRRRFEMGALSTGRSAFYARLGWERWQGPTFVGFGPEARRTEEEDDGIMVLRFGASSAIGLDAVLSCESRPGDDW